MAATTLMKTVIILVCINSLLFVSGVRVIGEDNNEFIDKFIDINKSGSGVIAVSGEFVDTLPTTLEESGGTSEVLQFVDSVGVVKRLIAFFINIIFTPLGLFISIGMTNEIVILVGLPLLVLTVLGMAYFIRSGG